MLRTIHFLTALVAVTVMPQEVAAQCSNFYGKTGIEYKYEGRQFGIFGIASSAIFCSDGVRYGEAETVEIVKRSPGPNAIKVREIHYDKSGSVRYEGFLLIRFGFVSTVIEETRIRGAKKYVFFTSWPSGR